MGAHESFKRKSIDTVTRDWSAHTNVVDSEAQTPKYESLQNRLFEQYIQRQLSGLFFEEAIDVGFAETQVSEMRNALAVHSDEEILAALSLPHELRERWLMNALTTIESGRQTPAECIEHLAQLGKKYGFTIGYHTSPRDIRPNEKGEWVIRGTEKDHRDGDLSMAYYSNQYRHLFKAKGPQYIYVVRAERDHRTDGNWNRAPSLSVIMRLPFAEVHEFVERSARKITESETEQ